MNIFTTTVPGRIADPSARTNLPQAPPPRPSPTAADVPAAKPAAIRAAAAVDENSRTGSVRSRELEAELAAANRRLADDGHEVRFEYDREANALIVRLVDLGTDTVLRQFPSDEALRAARLVRSGKPLISLQA